jgi:excisionase family DNA binding protein
VITSEPTRSINRDHVDDESSADGSCQRVACAESASRPKPAARRVEAKRRALTPASTGRDSKAGGERVSNKSRATDKSSDDVISEDVMAENHNLRVNGPALLLVSEVAAILRTSPKAVYAMVERGLLPGVVRIGRRVLVQRGDLVHWLSQKSAPSPER